MKTNTPLPIEGQGIAFAIDQINQQMIRELVKGARRPSARKPNECDEPPKCTHCSGDGQVYSSEEQGDVDCSYCWGRGYVPFEESEIAYLIVWRDWHSIECEVHLEHGKYKEAFVTVTEGDYKSGQSIELQLEEIAEAERAFEEKEAS